MNKFMCELQLREWCDIGESEPFTPFEDQGEIEFGSGQPCETCGYTGKDGEEALHSSDCMVVDPDFDHMDEGSSEDFSSEDSFVGLPIEDVDWEVFVVSNPNKGTLTYGDLPFLYDPREVNPTPYMLMERLQQKDYDKWDDFVPTYNQFTRDDCFCSNGLCLGHGEEECRMDITCSGCHGTLRCGTCKGFGQPINNDY